MESIKGKITSRIPDRSSLPSPGDKLKSLVGRGGSGSDSPVNARPISALGDPNRFGPPPKRTLPTEPAALNSSDTGGSSGAINEASKPRPPIADRATISASPKPHLPPRLPPRTGTNSSASEHAAAPPPLPSNSRPILSTPSEYTQATPRALPSNVHVGPAKLPPIVSDVDALLADTKKSSNSFASKFANRKPTTVHMKGASGRDLSFESYADDSQMKHLAEKGFGAEGLGINKDAPETSGWGSGKDIHTLAASESQLAAAGRKFVPPPPSRTQQQQSKPLTYEEAKAQVLAPLRESSSSGSRSFTWQEAKDSAATAKQNYNTAKALEAQHGDQLRSGLASANRLQERHGDKITKALGEEQAGQVRAGLSGATKSADLSKAVVGKKKPPPPPPKKKDLVVGQGAGGGPPPVNFGSKPVV